VNHHQARVEIKRTEGQWRVSLWCRSFSVAALGKAGAEDLEPTTRRAMRDVENTLAALYPERSVGNPKEAEA
jgi:hypothetical protein